MTVTESGGSTNVTEGGATDGYDIALTTTPAGTVSITVTADAQSEVSVDGVNYYPQLTFNRTDASPRTITVRPIDDAD
ncbi:MAG: hypothetical protein GTO22_23495, partial [Gemmatimonadales bacterium]|nr:hypothetical protein [Gemmatimonadales bacterium]